MMLTAQAVKSLTVVSNDKGPAPGERRPGLNVKEAHKRPTAIMIHDGIRHPNTQGARKEHRDTSNDMPSTDGEFWGWKRPQLSSMTPVLYPSCD